MNVRTQTGALTARWSILMVLTVAILVGGAGIYYTTIVQRQTIKRTEQLQRQSDQRWCPLLILADRPNPARPPQTPDEVEARRVLHQLRLNLRCGDN